MNKGIEQLIKRFMDGQTTVDEENRIAEYLRTHEVEDEWKAYKDMFGWFDEGMPLQSNGQKHTAKNRNKAITVAMLMAAAAAIVALVMIVRPGTPDIMPEQHAVNTAGKLATEENIISPKDTLAIDSMKKEAVKPNKKKSRIKRRVYNVMPPKTYLAKSERDSINVVADQMAEEKLRQICFEQEQKIREIYDLYNRQDIKIELIMAALEEGIDYETEGNEYY